MAQVVGLDADREDRIGVADAPPVRTVGDTGPGAEARKPAGAAAFLRSSPFRHDPECQTFRDFEPVNDEELERARQPEEQGKFHFARAWFEEALVGWRGLSSQMRAWRWADRRACGRAVVCLL